MRQKEVKQLSTRVSSLSFKVCFENIDSLLESLNVIDAQLASLEKIKEGLDKETKKRHLDIGLSVILESSEMMQEMAASFAKGVGVAGLYTLGAGIWVGGLAIGQNFDSVFANIGSNTLDAFSGLAIDKAKRGFRNKPKKSRADKRNEIESLIVNLRVKVELLIKQGRILTGLRANNKIEKLSARQNESIYSLESLHNTYESIFSDLRRVKSKVEHIDSRANRSLNILRKIETPVHPETLETLLLLFEGDLKSVEIDTGKVNLTLGATTKRASLLLQEYLDIQEKAKSALSYLKIFTIFGSILGIVALVLLIKGNWIMSLFSLIFFLILFPGMKKKRAK